MEEIELSFRLDENGRTSRPQQEEQRGKDENGETAPSASIDYRSKTLMTNLSPSFSSSSIDEDHQKWIDDLLFDCQISDSGLMPRTFWVPARGMKARCQLEQMALDIFHHHVPPGHHYDPETSGAEWWAQIRPSPEGTGRYSMHDDKPDELSTSGISFHWDKDEDLRQLTGGTTYLHPHISTVTYLTDLGGPTVALNHRVHNLTGEWLSPEDTVEGFVSWPKTGKHLSFDGRFLHAAPADLMQPGVWEEQITVPEVSCADNEKKKQEERLLRRRHRRVTFLVNVWLNFKPFDVKPFPETMISKMSGTVEDKRQTLVFAEGKDELTEALEVSGNESGMYMFTYPMGDCDSGEFIDANLPLQRIRKQAENGGNLDITWKCSTDAGEPGVRLYKKASTKRKSEEKCGTSKDGGTKRSKGSLMP